VEQSKSSLLQPIEWDTGVKVFPSDGLQMWAYLSGVLVCAFLSKLARRNIHCGLCVQIDIGKDKEFYEIDTRSATSNFSVLLAPRSSRMRRPFSSTWSNWPSNWSEFLRVSWILFRVVEGKSEIVKKNT